MLVDEVTLFKINWWCTTS